MLLDRPQPRINIMVFVSLGLHALLIGFFGAQKFSEAPRKLKLTEVEFQEEIAKTTEMEKLMTKLVAPKPPPPSREMVRIAAIEELEKTSFTKAAGVKAAPKPKLDDLSELDLTSLAALPKLNVAGAPPPPAIRRVPPKRIALVRNKLMGLEALDSKIVPTTDLPPADFGPEIARRGFQQPELIIKKVKAERRARATTIDKAKRLSLKRDSFISGEVKNREILHREYPAVPRWVEEKGIRAEVVIRFVVNPDGEVGDKIFIEKTSGYGELDRLAVAALKKFLFVPLPLKMKQKEQSGTIIMGFGLR